MRRTIRTFIALATVALGVAGYLISTDHKTLASRCFYASVAFYSAALLLFLITYVSRSFSRRYARIQKDAPVFTKQFTVKFDTRTLEPHCPVCRTELAPVVHPTTGVHTGSHFKCIPCNHMYCLTNEETGKPITLKEAKAILSPPQLEAANKPESPKLQADVPPQPLTTSEPKTEDTPSNKTELAFNFTVLWNKEATPFCPFCEGRLFPCHNITHKDTEELRCASCYSTFLLLDDNRKRISLPEAMRRLLSPMPKPRPTFNPDETDVKILSFWNSPLSKGMLISKMNAPLNLGQSRFNSHYAQLKKENFLEENGYNAESKTKLISLTNKAKELLKQTDHESSPTGFKPDITQEELLMAITTSEYKQLWCISSDAYIDQKLAKNNLDILEKKGFIRVDYRADRVRDLDDAIFDLTHRGRRYLIENHLLPDNF